MRYRYLFVALFLIFPSLLFAQRYRAGYIINLKGDTIKGFVSQHAWESNPRTVSFKTDSQSVVSKYSVADVKEFGINKSVTYRRYLTKISLATVDENHLFERDTAFKQDTVFLLVLQTGKNIDLLSYTDDIKTRYYVLEKNGRDPEELVYRVYMRLNAPASEPGRTKTENLYIQQLNNIALKYGTLTPKLIKDLPYLEYKEDHLVKAVALINGLKKPQAVKRKVHFWQLAVALLALSYVVYKYL